MRECEVLDRGLNQTQERHHLHERQNRHGGLLGSPLLGEQGRLLHRQGRDDSGRREHLRRRDLPGSAQLGGEGVPQPRPLRPARQGRPLRRLGTAAELRGRVVLVNFWTWTCINWLRQEPYVRAWSQAYRDDGLIVVGVHTRGRARRWVCRSHTSPTGRSRYDPRAATTRVTKVRLAPPAVPVALQHPSEGKISALD
jgi:thiol-disulfide isomerase/thioredoxin